MFALECCDREAFHRAASTGGFDSETVQSRFNSLTVEKNHGRVIKVAISQDYLARITVLNKNFDEIQSVQFRWLRTRSACTLHYRSGVQLSPGEYKHQYYQRSRDV